MYWRSIRFIVFACLRFRRQWQPYLSGTMSVLGNDCIVHDWYRGVYTSSPVCSSGTVNWPRSRSYVAARLERDATREYHRLWPVETATVHVYITAWISLVHPRGSMALLLPSFKDVLRRRTWLLHRVNIYRKCENDVSFKRRKYLFNNEKHLAEDHGVVGQDLENLRTLKVSSLQLGNLLSYYFIHCNDIRFFHCYLNIIKYFIIVYNLILIKYIYSFFVKKYTQSFIMTNTKHNILWKLTVDCRTPLRFSALHLTKKYKVSNYCSLLWTCNRKGFIESRI